MRPHHVCEFTTLLLFALAGQLLAAPGYTVTWLGLLDADGNRSQANTINGGGQVAGWSSVLVSTSLEQEQGFRWIEGSALQPLGTLGGEESISWANNVAGWIVGWATDKTGQELAFVSRGGVMTALPDIALGGWPSGAYGINALGHIVGEAGTVSGAHATLWNYSGATDSFTAVDLHKAVLGQYSRAEDINDSNLVAGWGRVSSTGPDRACYWQNGGGTPLLIPTLGGRNSKALAVNTGGQIVGWSETASGSRHPFLYDGSSTIDLGVISGAEGEARGINSLGHVVGFSGGAGFLYRDHTLYDLNDCIQSGTGSITAAMDINDADQIVGAGVWNGIAQACLLAPAPQPQIVTAVSHRTHGGAGNFDVNVAGAGGIESRIGGPTRLVVVFDVPVYLATGTPADVTLSSGTVAAVSVTGSEVTVLLNGASTASVLTVGFPGVRSAPGIAAESTLCVRVLAGDSTADGSVNIFDLIAVRNKLNQPVAAGSFRQDVNVDGSINIFDLIATRNVLNRSVPACP